jgi:uncharacterized protein (TIGR00297 family)
VLAIGIALVARRARALTPDGAVAAAFMGTVAVAAGWGWGILLVAFFLSSTALSRLGASAKAERTGAIVAKGGERDAMQVVANGGVFALAALLALSDTLRAAADASTDARWIALGAGALAAAASDTWATEVGTLAGGTPRALRGWRRVAPGTSGAVSLAGTLAALAGAGAIALHVRVLGWPGDVALAVLAGGVAGSTVDTLLGATIQARRRCPRCDAPTERAVHRCGTATVADGGLAWLDNDLVNLACTIAGGLLAWSLAR